MIRQNVGRVARPASFAIAVLSLVGCSSSRGQATPEFGVIVGGFDAGLTDAQLSDRAPIVVTVTVNSERIAPLDTHPDLPADWETEEFGSELVNGGAARHEWRVTVDSTIKGSVPASLWAVRGLTGENHGLEASGSPLGDTVAVGSAYTMWLEPDPWFGGDYYVLVRARLLQ